VTSGVTRPDVSSARVAVPALGRDGMLVVLAGAAGVMDAVAYLGLGVFTTMMTGNTALLALAIARGELGPLLRAGLALAAFGTGAVIGTLITGRSPCRGEWRSAVTGALACEAILLGVFAAVWHVAGPARGTGTTGLLILVSGLAMGIQSAAIRDLGIPGVATTYITSTLTSLSGELVGWARSNDGTRARRVRLLAAVVVSYGLGALVGAVLEGRSSTPAAWLPLIAVVVVVVNASATGRHALLVAMIALTSTGSPTIRSSETITTPPRSLAELFLGFLSIGARSFGGVLPAAHYVMVERRHWLTPADFTETIGLCQALPGPNVGNAAIVLGKRWFGLSGAIVAFLGLFALPYLWVLALALVYTHWAARPLVSAVVTGVGASAAGLLVATAVKLGRPMARKPAGVALMAGCFVAVAIGRIPLPVVMPIALSVGIALSRGGLL